MLVNRRSGSPANQSSVIKFNAIAVRFEICDRDCIAGFNGCKLVLRIHASNTCDGSTFAIQESSAGA
jgi:hypothetical protein